MIRKLLIALPLLLLILLSGCQPISGHKSKTPTPAPATPTSTGTPITIDYLSSSLNLLSSRVTTIENKQGSPADTAALQKQISELTTKVNTISAALAASPNTTPTPIAISELTNIKSELASLSTAVSALYQVAAGNVSDSPQYMGTVNIGIANNAPTKWIGQTFYVSQAGYLTGLNATFGKLGNPGTVTFYIESATGAKGLPTNKILGSGTMSTEAVGTAFGPWYHVSLTGSNGPCYLTTGYYAIVVSAPQSDASNWFSWGADSSGAAATYTPGSAVISTDTGRTWVAQTSCMVFTLNIQTSLTGGTAIPTATNATSLLITPNTATIVHGSTQQFTATAIYSNGTTANVTTSVAWISQNSGVASIGYNTGLATGMAAGSTAISAYLLGVGGVVQLSAPAVNITVN